MTNDIVINNIINELCQKFNVAASDLVPRLQAYGMAMNLYGAIVAAAFCIVFLICTIIIAKKWHDIEDIAFGVFVMLFFESIPLIVMLYNIYMYIGWKYAPEVKSIEYVMRLFKS